MPKMTDAELDKNVLYFLKQHVGKENAIGRWEIVTKIFGMGACFPESDDNLADRQIRSSVARLRRRGLLVCDMGDGRGRYLASSLAEYDAFRAYFGSAAFEKMETIRAMDKSAEREFPEKLQPRLFS
jgi:hypothetical protein